MKKKRIRCMCVLEGRQDEEFVFQMKEDNEVWCILKGNKRNDIFV